MDRAQVKITGKYKIRPHSTKLSSLTKRSDVLRAMILMAYGGIYLDNDVYVINSLDKYRKFEMTAGWEVIDKSIGSQVFIAHRQARFLKDFVYQYRFIYLIKYY